MYKEIQNIATEIIEKELNGLSNIKDSLRGDFQNVINYILKNEAKVIVTGVGKSAIIGQKFVATLVSTGSPAQFIHITDALHGDLGAINKDDFIIIISKSGNTDEIKRLLPVLRSQGNKIAAILSNEDSYLAKTADYVIFVPIIEEACPYNIVPSTSTTAHLIITDSIALTLSKMKSFTTSDFAKTHPGGSLGKKLYMKVEDVFDKTNKPCIPKTANVREFISNISSHMLGATVVLENEKVLGIITDGDLRRMLESNDNISSIKAVDIMTINPKTIRYNDLAYDAFKKMEENKITSLVVLDDKNRYLGIIHIHDIIREGIG